MEPAQAALKRVKDRLDLRLNNYLCDMKEGFDDSIAGFNEAWTIMNDIFKEELKDEVTVHIDKSEIDVPQVDRCPHHPDLLPEIGYGLAGGGIGVYSYCPECGTVLSKSQDHS